MIIVCSYIRIVIKLPNRSTFNNQQEAHSLLLVMLCSVCHLLLSLCKYERIEACIWFCAGVDSGIGKVGYGLGPPKGQPRNLCKMRGWRACKEFRGNKNNVFSWVLINNKASNTRQHLTTFFSALGPHTEHWSKAPWTLKLPLVMHHWNSTEIYLLAIL